MRRHRTTARGVFLLLILSAATASAAAAFPDAKPGKGKPAGVPKLVFPVVGEAAFTDDYGDPRGSHAHAGNDIMAPRKALAVAAEAGVVKFWTTSARAGCMLYLEGASGTQYLYIHLNNDLGSGNDNKGSCVAGVAFPKGLASGDSVEAGEPVGFVGDSGDANGVSPHLHFEVHPGGGADVNPYPHLRSARRLLFAAKAGSTFTLALTGTVVEAVSGSLEVSVERLRSWPGGRKIEQGGRKIAVSVPDTASVESNGLIGETPALDALLQGTGVTVWTEPAPVTLAAQTGVKYTLAAQRVVVR